MKARHGELSVFEQSTVLELQQAERWGALEEDYFWVSTTSNSALLIVQDTVLTDCLLDLTGA